MIIKSTDSCLSASTGSPSALVRRSAEFITGSSSEIAINHGAIPSLAQLLAHRYDKHDLSLECWKNHELHPKTADVNAVDWIFVIDSLNFSFWAEIEDSASPERFMVNYDGKLWTGYWSCCAAVNRALDEGIPLLNADYLSQINDEQIRHIFRATKGVMPMLHERTRNLQEVGTVLKEKYEGSFSNCIAKAQQSSQTLLNLILTDFPCFRDEGIYKNEKVAFYKRAQILVADVWACFEGKGLGAFHDIDQLTIFADYRIPQVLNHFGLTTYSGNLQRKLDENYMWKNGSDEEMQIRGCTIHACELLVQELNRILERQTEQSHVNAVMLDFYLWDYGQLHEEDIRKTPYHKVRCIYY